MRIHSRIRRASLVSHPRAPRLKVVSHEAPRVSGLDVVGGADVVFSSTGEEGRVASGVRRLDRTLQKA